MASGSELFIERAECPACASREVRLWCASRFDLAPVKRILEETDIAQTYPAILHHPYEIWICSACRLIYQRYVLREEPLNYYYGRSLPDEATRRLDFGYSAIPHLAQLASDVLLLLNHLRKDPIDLKVYEFGQGWGRWLQLMRAAGCKVSCHDLSPSRNAAMASMGIACVEPTALESESLNVINCDQVLEHLANPRITFTALARALKPGGLLAIDVPNCWRLHRLGNHSPSMDRIFSDRQLSSLVHPLEHVNAFVQQPLLRMAADAGLVRAKPSAARRWACATYYVSPKRILRNLLGPVRDLIMDRSVKLWLMKPGKGADSFA